MDSRKKIIGIITLSLCISISLAMAAGNTWAAAKPVEISVIGGNEGRGGKHKGYFEATYSGKKIKVIYSYKANRANPMEHPIKVYQGDKKIADWECYLQQGNNQQLAIKDREISSDRQVARPENFRSVQDLPAGGYQEDWRKIKVS